MDDMNRDNQAAEDSTAPTVDRSERQAGTVAQAAGLLANPRRVRRA